MKKAQQSLRGRMGCCRDRAAICVHRRRFGGREISGMVVAPRALRVRRLHPESKTNPQGVKDMGDQQQPDRNKEHDRRNQQQQEEERRRREGISKPPPAKDDQAE
ncbi:MAG TPA: hypothetical protein VE907_01335 [Gammaproteobacteria bacterium]|nr:hypothetical protein [Gammaproteobacteria bacterium]